MPLERTLSIVKPAAVDKTIIGKIYERFESSGCKSNRCLMIHRKREQAEACYSVQKERPFYGELVQFMTSGPVVVQVLEGEDAIRSNRRVMGATNPAEAEPGTIRADFADSVQANAVHGSDGPDTARSEIAFFFDEDQICPRE